LGRVAEGVAAQGDDDGLAVALFVSHLLHLNRFDEPRASHRLHVSEARQRLQDTWNMQRIRFYGDTTSGIVPYDVRWQTVRKGTDRTGPFPA
ncbi:hypothetical protein, partial [Adlercreutzia muris]